LREGARIPLRKFIERDDGERLSREESNVLAMRDSVAAAPRRAL
jgi:hypothetical protein